MIVADRVMLRRNLTTRRNTQADIYFKVYNDDIRIGRLVLSKSLVTFETLSPPFSC